MDSMDCASNDPKIWQNLDFSFVDEDKDGSLSPISGKMCVGAGLPEGYFDLNESDKIDCDDHDNSVQVQLSVYPDADGDGYGKGVELKVCALGAPDNFSISNSDPDDSDALKIPGDRDGDKISDENDCNPDNSSVWQMVDLNIDKDRDTYSSDKKSLCIGNVPPNGYRFTASGPDCDDTKLNVHEEQNYYADKDGDGDGAGPQISLCAAQEPDGYSWNGFDCDDSDPTLWQSFYGFHDLDGDGLGGEFGGKFCAKAVPIGYVEVNGDCDDTNPLLKKLQEFWIDGDNDGYGMGAVAPKQLCVDGVPAGYSLNPYDNDDSNPAVNLRSVTAAVYTGVNGIASVFIKDPGYVSLVVSSYSRANWCVYGKATIVQASAMGYYRNTFVPQRQCADAYVPNCPSINVSGVQYNAISVPGARYSTSCVQGYSSGTYGSYITPYDVYSGLVTK